ncbi:MAG: DJ-1/PfpI/YhbO family deglycase/protease [Candidatus Eisenbacteria bacterium]|nr:DJ-1/PfpI/YhbO family deglycase/protease [Candidatus Eisenbacteria bacterium]
MQLSGRRIAIFVAPQFEDLELWYPRLRLQEAGAEVTVIGPEEGKWRGKQGTTVESQRAIRETSSDDFDALVIPGGYAPDHMRRVPEMIEFVQRMHTAGKPIAAICHAGWMLASADILEGRRVTSFFSIRADLVHAGAEWVDAEVVQDGHLITSRHPGDLPAFCRAIIAALTSAQVG